MMSSAGKTHLYAVRAHGVRHYVRVETKLGLHGPALCSLAPFEATGFRAWRALKSLSDGAVCNACHAVASRELAVITFPV